MAQERRKSPREPLALDATCRRTDGRACPVRLREISRLGCRAEFSAGPAPLGERVLLHLDNCVSLLATVQWSRTGQAGLAFANPLHGAILMEFAKKAQKPAKH